MAFVPVVDVAQIEIRATLNTIPVENTWFAQKVGGWDQTSLDALTQEVSDAVVASWLSDLSPAWFGREVYARDLSASAANESTNLDISGIPGVVSGTPLPGNVTLAIQRNAGLTGRSSRGRIFWMGLTSALLDTNENFVSSGTDGALVADCEAIDAAIVAAGAQSVIVSRFFNGAPRLTPVVYPVVQWKVTDRKIDTLRERLK